MIPDNTFITVSTCHIRLELPVPVQVKRKWKDKNRNMKYANIDNEIRTITGYF
jgi:hypothetical protein